MCLKIYVRYQLFFQIYTLFKQKPTFSRNFNRIVLSQKTVAA